MARRNSYLANYEFILPPGLPGFVVTTSRINNACRRMFLSCVTFNYQLFNQTTLTLLPNEQNNIMIAELTLGTPVLTQPFCNIVEPIGLPIPVAARDIFLWEPGQYFYNNIKFDNEVLITLNFANQDGANTYRVRCHILIETEE